MKILNICIFTSILMFTNSPIFADLSISYGEGAGKVDYINNNKYSELEEPLPFGPLSFRIVGDKTWVADSVGGKLMQFDQQGKLISEFSVMPKGIKPYEIDEGFPTPNILIEDIAPVFGQNGNLESWWIVDSNENRLIKFSADGKPLAVLQDPNYGQLFRVEVGVGGHLFVADKANRKIYIYDSNGEYMSEQNWEWSGMAVAGKDDLLYRLVYFKEENRNILVTTNVDGKVLSSKTIEVEMNNPELWWVDEVKGEAVITYTPQSGFEGEFNIVRVGLDGKVKASGIVPAPFVMNRFIEHMNFEKVYIGKCNYSEAPKGNFEIVPFKMP